MQMAGVDVGTEGGEGGGDGGELPWPLLLCPQSVFKMHPSFDAVLGAVLLALPHARLVVTAGTAVWYETRAGFLGVAHVRRVHFIRRY